MAPPEPENQATLSRRSSILHGPQARFPGARRWGGGGGRLRIPRLLETRLRPSQRVSGFEACAAAAPLRIPRLLENRTRLSQGVSGPGKSGRSSMGTASGVPVRRVQVGGHPQDTGRRMGFSKPVLIGGWSRAADATRSAHSCAPRSKLLTPLLEVVLLPFLPASQQNARWARPRTQQTRRPLL